uniref:Uncharacterized protein n=1 Tax=Mycena chlorophos TaxID=658473 RepID=A0ABQ0L8Y2_MYCCL|nr:predicted protein [Mycena chlorophos]
MDAADPGMRIWIQLWGQMHSFQATVVKLFSPAGVVYVRRDNFLSTTLHLSKTYDDLDGDVKRTTCVILEARSRARQLSTLALRVMVRCHDWTWHWMFSLIWFLQLLWISRYRGVRGTYVQFNHRDVFFRDVSENFDCASSISARSFTKLLGRGLSGIVMRSGDGADVVKLFDDGNLARHELHLLRLANGLAVPQLRGVISRGGQTGLVMSYEGSPIINLGGATRGGETRRLSCTSTSQNLHLHILHRSGAAHDDLWRPNAAVFTETPGQSHPQQQADAAAEPGGQAGSESGPLLPSLFNLTAEPRRRGRRHCVCLESVCAGFPKVIRVCDGSLENSVFLALTSPLCVATKRRAALSFSLNYSGRPNPRPISLHVLGFDIASFEQATSHRDTVSFVYPSSDAPFLNLQYTSFLDLLPSIILHTSN